MTINLNDFNDYQDCFYFSQDDEFEENGGFSAEFGQGHDCWIYLRNGLELAISTDQYSDLVIERGCSSDFLNIQFYLSGGIRIVAPTRSNSTDSYDASANHSLLFHLPEPHERQYPAVNQQTQWVRIFCPTEFLAQFHQSFAPLPQPLQQLIEGNLAQPICQSGMITPMMHLALQQILHCPFQGTLKQVYLEGKVLELLALQLGQWSEGVPALPALTFRADEIDRLHHAKMLLSMTFQHPPSLLDLAHQVGINDYKLKRGFRELFQTTVLGYVQSLRLEQAKQLLRGTKLTIAEIAHQVGYDSVSHFGYLFKRHAGQTPSAYRQS